MVLKESPLVLRRWLRKHAPVNALLVSTKPWLLVSRHKRTGSHKLFSKHREIWWRFTDYSTNIERLTEYLQSIQPTPRDSLTMIDLQSRADNLRTSFNCCSILNLIDAVGSQLVEWSDLARYRGVDDARVWSKPVNSRSVRQLCRKFRSWISDIAVLHSRELACGARFHNVEVELAY